MGLTGLARTSWTEPVEPLTLTLHLHNHARIPPEQADLIRIKLRATAS
jgi:hypothetical protein